jgi:hypothetical protein
MEYFEQNAACGGQACKAFGFSKWGPNEKRDHVAGR